MSRRLISHFTSLALLCAFVVYTLVAFWGAARNADWSAYETLYLGDGAWLADQGRDFGFLTLVQYLSKVINYEDFRLLLALYFGTFTFWFVNAWRSRAIVDRYFLSYVALLPLLYPRITVQIREGIAITFILAAIVIFSRRVEAQRSAGVFPLILMVFATTIHAAAAIVLVMMYLPRIFFALKRQRLVLCVGVAAILIAIVALIDAGIESTLVLQILEGGWSGFEFVETTSDSAKMIYWAARTAAVLHLIHLLKQYTADFDIHTRRFLKVSGYLMVPALHLLVIWLVFSGQNALVASTGIRVLNMVFFLALALVGLRARKRLPLLAIVAFFVYDQHRVLMVHQG
jgi:hypothetical protein